MPLDKTKNMKSHYMSLQPYTTEKVMFNFYFPSVGVFTHFPSNVSVEGEVLARGGASTMKVVQALSHKEIKNFQDLLAEDLKDDVLKFLETENLLQGAKGFRFKDMMYLLKDREYFLKVVAIL